MLHTGSPRFSRTPSRVSLHGHPPTCATPQTTAADLRWRRLLDCKRGNLLLYVRKRPTSLLTVTKRDRHPANIAIDGDDALRSPTRHPPHDGDLFTDTKLYAKEQRGQLGSLIVRVRQQYTRCSSNSLPKSPRMLYGVTCGDGVRDDARKQPCSICHPYEHWLSMLATRTAQWFKVLLSASH